MKYSNIRSKLDWILPFILSGGMAFGSLIGMTGVSDLASDKGSAGDLAGAAGALMILICSGTGFVMAMLTVIAGKLFHRGEPQRFALRFGVSILGGGVIGILGWKNTAVSTISAWFLLLVLPVLLVWFWRANAGPEITSQNE